MAKNIETEIIVEKLSFFKKDNLINQKKIETLPPILYSDNINNVLLALRSNWIQDVAGYFSNCRSQSEYSKLNNEYKVQDLLYCQLCSILSDLQYEDPNSKTKGALTSTRIDFVSKSEKLFIEVKHASTKHTARKIESEISEDIIKYGKTGNFKYLIFFIYCNNYSFPNKQEFEQGFTGVQTIFDNNIETICIIKP